MQSTASCGHSRAPGEPCDRPFPENSFNPTWTPHCPDLKPAFAEICITWELEYPHACCQELLKRAASHRERLRGAPVPDVEVVHKVQRAQAAVPEIKKLGSYTAGVKLHPEVKATMKIDVVAQ